MEKLSSSLLFISFFLHLCSVGLSNNTPPSPATIQLAIDNLQYNKATVLLKEYASTSVANPIFVQYFTSNIAFYNAIFNETPSAIDSFKIINEKCLHQIEKINASERIEFLFLINLLLKAAYIHSRAGSLSKTMSNIISAYNISRKVKNKWPTDQQNRRYEGLFECLAANLPEGLKWAANVRGLKGNVQKGLTKLKFSEEQNLPSVLDHDFEILYILSLTYLSEKPNEALQAIMQLKNRSVSMDILKVLIFFKCQNNDEAIEIMNNYISKLKLPSPYLNLLYGRALLQKLDPNAKTYLLAFAKDYKGTNYFKSNQLRVLWYFQIFGSQVEVDNSLSSINSKGTTHTPIDKQALYEISNSRSKNIRLLKSRLLFDGGYYSRSLVYLLSTNGYFEDKSKDQIEYYYRLGRIYHALGDADKSILNYKKAIYLGKNAPWYFAANSAYQLGLLYKNQNDTIVALHFFYDVSKMKNEEYKNEFRIKAEKEIKSLSQ